MKTIIFIFLILFSSYKVNSAVELLVAPTFDDMDSDVAKFNILPTKPTTVTDRCAAYSVLGFFGKKGGNHQTVSLEVDTAAAHHSVYVSFDYMIKGEWNGEELIVKADGVQVDNQKMLHSNKHIGPHFLRFHRGSYTDAYGRKLNNFDCGTAAIDHYLASVSFQVDHTAAKFTLEVTSDLFKSVPDAGWGIRNVKVTTGDCNSDCIVCESLNNCEKTKNDVAIRDLSQKEFTKASATSEGWSWTSAGSNPVFKCVDTTYLGGFNIGTSNIKFEKTYSNLPSHHSLTFKISVRGFDAIENERVFFEFDGVRYTKLQLSSTNWYFNGRSEGSGFVKDNFIKQFCGASRRDYPYDMEYRVVLPHTADSLKVVIKNDLTYIPSDESYGYRDAELIPHVCHSTCSAGCSTSKPCRPNTILVDSLAFYDWYKVNENKIAQDCFYDSATQKLKFTIQHPLLSGVNNVEVIPSLTGQTGVPLYGFSETVTGNTKYYTAEFGLDTLEAFTDCKRELAQDPVTGQNRYEVVTCNTEIRFEYEADSEVVFWKGQNELEVTIDLHTPERKIDLQIKTKIIDLPCRNCQPACKQNCRQDANFGLTGRICQGYDAGTKLCTGSGDRSSNLFTYGDVGYFEFSVTPATRTPSLHQLFGKIPPLNLQTEITSYATRLSNRLGHFIIKVPMASLASTAGRPFNLYTIARLEKFARRNLEEENTIDVQEHEMKGLMINRYDPNNQIPIQKLDYGHAFKLLLAALIVSGVAFIFTFTKLIIAIMKN